MIAVQLTALVNNVLSSLLPEFFEECIKEEQYEAQKLDILRDAVRAKVTYSSETKRLSKGGSPDPLETEPSVDLPTSDAVANGGPKS